jgi:hypothetical protein
MTSMSTSTAPVRWAQRYDSLYITISLKDVEDHKISLSAEKLHFEGKSDGKYYTVDLEFVRFLPTYF